MLLLRTQIFENQDFVPAIENALQKIVNTELTINPEVMTTTDWDEALQAILNHDRCLTL